MDNPSQNCSSHDQRPPEDREERRDLLMLMTFWLAVFFGTVAAVMIVAW
jgi:hypothetical protein